MVGDKCHMCLAGAWLHSLLTGDKFVTAFSPNTTLEQELFSALNDLRKGDVEFAYRTVYREDFELEADFAYWKYDKNPKEWRAEMERLLAWLLENGI